MNYARPGYDKAAKSQIKPFILKEPVQKKSYCITVVDKSVDYVVNVQKSVVLLFSAFGS